MTREPERLASQARIVALALAAGALVTAGVAVALVDGGPIADLGPGTDRLLLLGWAGVTLGCAAAWYALWRRAKDLGTSTAGLRRVHGDGEAPGPGRAFGSLVAAWAVLEASAVLGAVVYMMTARGAALAGGLLVMALGMALSFPRSEWFAPFRGHELPEGPERRPGSEREETR
ncbi:MAG: hypothetical protein R3199_01715 [Gemmatimonadota bacterium]|nr:hypothetical protein [Gemmatimonadota bacterium]